MIKALQSLAMSRFLNSTTLSSHKTRMLNLKCVIPETSTGKKQSK
jgi:hypothetical protein